ncbi:MAG: AI-2E family transporter [Bacillota bacterium]
MKDIDKQWAFTGRLLLLLLVLVGTIWLLKSISWVIGLILISTLIVYILYPLLLFLENRFRLSHGLATILTFLVFLLFSVFVISLLIPVIFYEAVELADNFPHYLSRFQAYLSWLTQQMITLDIEGEVRSFLLGLTDNIHQAVEYLAEASLSLIGGAVDFILVLFLVFYLLYDFQAVREQLIELVPTAKRAIAREVLSIIDTNVGTFIRGSLLRCLIVGIVTGITLSLAGMPYALLLGLLAGIFNFILYIGPYIAAVPAVLLSFSPLTPSPVLIILIYIVIQILDGMFLAPLVLGRVVKIKPITVIVAILIGASLAGLLGMVLAVPVAGMVKGILEIIKSGPAYENS